MKYKCADENRDAGIRLLYDAILQKHIKDNHTFRESKEAAYDAVQLRYSLSRKRIKAIVNQQARGDATPLLPSLRFENKSIIEDLEQEISYLENKIRENRKLIELIGYVCENYRVIR